MSNNHSQTPNAENNNPDNRNPGYEWMDIYSDIATRIVQDGENKNDGFIEKTLELLKDRGELTPTFFQDGSKDIRHDVDPFSFFALLNFNEGKRKKILEIIQENVAILGLKEFTPPQKFNGIPRIRHPAIFFNTEKDNRNVNLWNLFCVAMKCNQDNFDSNFENAFTLVKGLYGPHWFTTSSVLFAMKPDVFLPLDDNTRTFLLDYEKKNPGVFGNNIELLKALKTAPTAKQYLAILEYIKRKLVGETNEENKPEEGVFEDIHTFAQLSYEAWRSSSFAQTFELLEENHQVILTGAPGTGKTYTAKQVAKEFIEEHKSLERFKQLIPNFEKKASLKEFFKKLRNLNFVDQLPDYDPNKWQDKIFTARVQFHPGYDYSDFVVGLKPTPSGEKVSFDWEDGVFKTFADRAKTVYDEWCNQGNPPEEAPTFVFIIDEINRADLSRVFGELFSLLEGGYRYSRKKDGTEGDENSLSLPNGDEFVIPENLFIIGTMNDIDRSVESMDFALRRRFAWLEVTAEQSECILDAWAEKKGVGSTIVEKLKKAMETLNDYIRGYTLSSKGKRTEKKLEGVDLKLGPEYELGGAYFKQFGDDKTDDVKASYEKLWDNHIRIILSEYLRGNRDREKLLMELYKKYIGEDGCGF